MTDEQTPDAPREHPPITELTSRQRRVLGVLVEKAFTTPEYYPLTLKAVIAGCNQKSNRDPVVEYGQFDVEEALDELRELGLAAVVHTESGRTERFRHYMRHRFTLTEPQLAILIELLLRGRQQLGELRSRASRMVAIDSLDVLRQELADLLEQKLIQTSGPLERRGVEVDHNLYTQRERDKHALTGSGEMAEEPSEAVATAAPPATAGAERTAGGTETLQTIVEQLRDENRELRESLQELQQTVAALQRDVETLRRDLGG